MTDIDKGNVLLKFSADWCGPCKAFAPVIKKIAGEFVDNLNVIEVDVDSDPELAKKYRVKSIPAVILLKNGKIIDQFTGTLHLEAVRQKVKNLIETKEE